MPPAPAVTTVSSVVGAGVVTVMSTTRSASAAVAGGHRDHRGGARAVAGVGGRVGAAISHGWRDGQGRPQQDRDRQQAPGTGSVHPGSMGPRAPAHARLGPGSPERVECRPERFEPAAERSEPSPITLRSILKRDLSVPVICPGAAPGAFGV